MTEQPSPLQCINNSLDGALLLFAKKRITSLDDILDVIVTSLWREGLIDKDNRGVAISTLAEMSLVDQRYFDHETRASRILRDLCSRDFLTHDAMVAATMDLLEDAHND